MNRRLRQPRRHVGQVGVAPVVVAAVEEGPLAGAEGGGGHFEGDVHKRVLWSSLWWGEMGKCVCVWGGGAVVSELLYVLGGDGQCVSGGAVAGVVGVWGFVVACGGRGSACMWGGGVFFRFGSEA